MTEPNDNRDGAWIIRAEEEVTGARAEWRGAGLLRARKDVEIVPVDVEVPREVERAGWEHVPVAEGDSGEIQTLEDGTVSIPIFEEELVVTKRTVLRERVLVRKTIETETVRVQDELRREHASVDADPGIEVVDEPG